MQLKTIDLTIKVKFLAVNLKDAQPLEENELKSIFQNFLGESLYLPEYTSKGEINQKDYEIRYVFDRPNSEVLSLNVGEPPIPII